MPKLLCHNSLGLTSDILEDLESRGHQFLYVLKSNYERVSSILHESLQEILSDRSVPGSQRFSMLQFAVAPEVETAFRRTDCSRLVTLVTQIGSQIAKLLTESPVVPQELFDMVQHDKCTFTHVTNVAAYAVLLAHRLEVGEVQELEKIAVGAMLHDFGNRYIPEEILSKPGLLTPEEKHIVESHTLLGYKELCQHKELELGQLMMVYQHHERANGTGYPVGILEEDIHPWARLLSVVDVFDAMTTRRSYREPVNSSDALLYLAENAKTQFTPEEVLCWISAFHRN